MKSLSRLQAEFATAQQRYKRRSMGDRIGDAVVGKTGVGMAARGLALAGAIRYGGVARKEIGAALAGAARKGFGKINTIKHVGGFARTNVPKALGEAVRADIGRARVGLASAGNVVKGIGNALLKPEKPFQMSKGIGGLRQTQKAMRDQTKRRVGNMMPGSQSAVYPVTGRTKKGYYRY